MLINYSILCKFGKEGKDNGILLLITKGKHRVRLEIGIGLEPYLTASRCGAILDKYFVPYREQNNYTEATEQTVKAVIGYLALREELEVQGDSSLSVQEPHKEIDVKSVILWTVCIVLSVLSGAFGDSSRK